MNVQCVYKNDAFRQLKDVVHRIRVVICENEIYENITPCEHCEIITASYQDREFIGLLFVCSCAMYVCGVFLPECICRFHTVVYHFAALVVNR